MATVKYYEMQGWGGTIQPGQTATWGTGVVPGNRTIFFSPIPVPLKAGELLPGTFQVETTRVWTALQPDGVHFHVEFKNVGNAAWNYRVFATDIAP
ncbi:hypothetical protein [Saccharothrix australiensis]|uniref:Uncharacterized protein n=1 Tax=Saccharothrix australiensis TaxID=2072 RepID=A0A495W1A3_9PSEU|nr:hypothetical protein [Saccharothrix australiensis]RKT55452.1 hypothetical protein C8E97_4120 [Saccharothrix australiensis]